MFGKMFFVSVILLQVFTFGLGRSLQWLFAPWIGKIGRRWLMGISYFITNGLLVGLLLELGHMMFRVVAFWMVILLFVMYAALATFILYLLLRRFMARQPLSRSLRLFAPLFVIGLLGLGMYNAYTPVVAIRLYSSIRRWISRCVSAWPAICTWGFCSARVNWTS